MDPHSNITGAGRQTVSSDKRLAENQDAKTKGAKKNGRTRIVLSRLGRIISRPVQAIKKSFNLSVPYRRLNYPVHHYLATSQGISNFPEISPVYGRGVTQSIFRTSFMQRFKMRRYTSADSLMHVRWNGRESKKSDVETFRATGRPMLDTKQGFEYKKELISKAEKSIVLSGNYCGGESFDEVLDLILQRLQEKPELKVVIMSSPRFLTNSNKQKIEAITQYAEQRFQLVITDDLWMDAKQDFKKITNHTKGLVVDEQYCVMGGAGIEDKYAYYKGVGDKSDDKVDTEAKGNILLAALLPRGFRDMDFYFEGRDMALKLNEELLKLACLWEHYGRYDCKSGMTVAREMLETCSRKERKQAVPSEKVPMESTDGNGMESGLCQIYSSGPEMSESAFYKKMLEEVRGAKEHIYIDHMYFHPTRELRAALAQKVNEGVKLTIVTNGNERFSPLGHKLFGVRNRQEIADMVALIDKDKRNLVDLYEFGQKYPNTPYKITLHKKVMVVDDTVLAGSSNLGYKSLVTSSDHEINFVMKSPEFAKKTIQAIEDDAFKIEREIHSKKGKVVQKTDGVVRKVTLSKKLKRAYRVSLINRFIAAIHKKCGWLVG